MLAVYIYVMCLVFMTLIYFLGLWKPNILDFSTGRMLDISGKMQGSLHRDLFKDPQTAVQVGSAIVLRQVE